MDRECFSRSFFFSIFTLLVIVNFTLFPTNTKCEERQENQENKNSLGFIQDTGQTEELLDFIAKRQEFDQKRREAKKKPNVPLVLLITFSLALLVFPYTFMIVDCIKRPINRFSIGSKVIWLFLLFGVGAFAFFMTTHGLYWVAASIPVVSLIYYAIIRRRDPFSLKSDQSGSGLITKPPKVSGYFTGIMIGLALSSLLLTIEIFLIIPHFQTHAWPALVFVGTAISICFLCAFLLRKKKFTLPRWSVPMVNGFIVGYDKGGNIWKAVSIVAFVVIGLNLFTFSAAVAFGSAFAGAIFGMLLQLARRILGRLLESRKS